VRDPVAGPVVASAPEVSAALAEEGPAEGEPVGVGEVMRGKE